MKLKEYMMNEGIFDEEPQRLSEEEQRELLDSIKGYNSFGKTIYREGNLVDIAKKVARIAEYAERFITESGGDWFDHVTIKRNMKELRNLSGAFGKIAKEQQQAQDRMSGIYEDMGNLLNRYFEIEDMQEMEVDPHPERNGMQVGDRVKVDMTKARKFDPRPTAVRKLKDQLRMGNGTVKINSFEGKMASISGGDVSVMEEIRVPIVALLKPVKEAAKFDAKKMERYVKGDRFLEPQLKTMGGDKRRNLEVLFNTYVLGDSVAEREYSSTKR